jgi:hypothetical protein
MLLLAQGLEVTYITGRNLHIVSVELGIINVGVGLKLVDYNVSRNHFSPNARLPV